MEKYIKTLLFVGLFSMCSMTCADYRTYGNEYRERTTSYTDYLITGAQYVAVGLLTTAALIGIGIGLYKLDKICQKHDIKNLMRAYKEAHAELQAEGTIGSNPQDENTMLAILSGIAGRRYHTDQKSN